MGLNEGDGRKTYLTISDGRIAKRCDEKEPGAIRCQNKEGDRIWFEKRYQSVTGKIIGAVIRENDYGKKLCIVIDDSQDLFELQMNLDSKYAKGFLRSMPSIDLTKHITFSPWMKKVVENGKEIKKTMLYLSYGPGDDQKIPWYWTKENPLGLPEMVQVRVKGKEQWDDTDQMDYLVNHLQEVFTKRLQEAKYAPDVVTAPAKTSPPAEVVDDETADDLPF